jgi:hypothetical protein
MGAADRELGTQASTDRREQPRVRPRLARARDGTRRQRLAERLVRNGHGATQRIAFAHGAQVRELARLAVEYDREQRHGVRGAEASAARFLEITFVDRLPRTYPDVGGEHLGGLQIYRRADAIDQKSHAGERGDGDREREQQHAQLARAPFAPEGSHCQSQCTHAASSSRRKPMRKCAAIATRARLAGGEEKEQHASGLRLGDMGRTRWIVDERACGIVVQAVVEDA